MALSYGVRLKVWGDYGCFSRPELRVERFSYDVMTPSAAVGILQAIHWKPAISWRIRAIHVLEPIRFVTVKRNELSEKPPVGNIRRAYYAGDAEGLGISPNAKGKRQQRNSRILVSPSYVIEADFEMTGAAGKGDNPGKHREIFVRRARKGQCFERPCMGMREFPAYFALVEDEEEFQTIDETRDLGMMAWGFDYGTFGKRKLVPDPLYFGAVMENGVVGVPLRGSGEVFG